MCVGCLFTLTGNTQIGAESKSHKRSNNFRGVQYADNRTLFEGISGMARCYVSTGKTLPSAGGKNGKDFGKAWLRGSSFSPLWV